MLCNLVNFISVNGESDVGRGRQWGEDMRKKESKDKQPQGERKGVQETVTTTTD